MQLTPLEKEILNHRLEVSDAIADSMHDGDPMDWQAQEIADACQDLMIDPTPTPRTVDAVRHELDKEILLDAVEGSVYYGSCIDVESPQKLAAVAKAGLSLAAKVSEAIGSNVTFPLY